MTNSLLFSRSSPLNTRAVEKLFFAKNVTTAMKVSEARGVILLTLQQHGIPVYEYTPLQVKQALTGYGRADKQQVQHLIKRIMGLDEIPKPDDVADGIALAVTHINTWKMTRKQKR
jgi:crossover junction endodeoxyribonuclease RuvC